jgi:pimeloyl-ACP methyl ester carboxylesterase
VSFFSSGIAVRGLLRLPDSEVTTALPTIVQGPGWLGLADSPWNAQAQETLTSAGYAVLTFDYRGFGDSDGERGWIHPDRQLEDIFNAVTFVETRDDLDSARLGYFGHGGTGGGNAIIAAALDERIRAVVAMEAVADAVSWLRGMRSEWEWNDFEDRIAANRRTRVLEGIGERVDPREEIMIASPDRRAETNRQGVDARVGAEFHLGSVEALMRYRPIDFVGRIAPRPLLLTTVDRGVVVPSRHAIALYEAAGEPKRLIIQKGTRSYTQYRDNYDLLMGEFISWFDTHLGHRSVG